MSARLVALLVGLLVIAGAANGTMLTSANTVRVSHVGVVSKAITPATLQPAECAANGIVPTNLVTGNGNITGSGSAELILGGPAEQTIRGSGGGDCLVGGGGVDHLQGQGGFDVCIGNSTTIFNNCNKIYIR